MLTDIHQLAYKELPRQVWEPLNLLLNYAMWIALVAAVASLIASAAMWGYQWKYPHFNTAVAPIRLVIVGVCCALLSGASGIANAVI